VNITITHIDTACVLLEIGDYRILTDPTLDDAGRIYYHGSGSFSRKTSRPSIPMDSLPPIDLVLLSHHQHKDNLDVKGREFLNRVSIIVSTRQAARAIKGITGLAPWESFSIRSEKLPGLTITATPARHHPSWVPHFLIGDVIGFVIEFDGQENGVLYITGDTVYFRGIPEVGKRFRINQLLAHVGSVQFRYLTGFGHYTMNSRDLLKAVEVLSPRIVVPIHSSGWSHFKENEEQLRKVLLQSPSAGRNYLFLSSGVAASL
jgi:L-ascorbate metabolism protein UlaG (beta-lactamase superfamily)